MSESVRKFIPPARAPAPVLSGQWTRAVCKNFKQGRAGAGAAVGKLKRRGERGW